MNVGELVARQGYSMRFATIYYCGHAVDGDAMDVSIEHARCATSVAYSWYVCPSCRLSGVQDPPAARKYSDEPHPGAFRCTKEAPWDPRAPRVPTERVVHVDAVEIDEHYDTSDEHNDYVTMRCPHCGHSWDKPMPN